MKAAVLKEFGKPLSVESIPNPTLGTGEVIVNVASAPILHYAKEVFNGERKYLLDLPLVPGAGAVGQVLEVGPDATNLTEGDWVWCDPTVRSRDDALSPDITLQGLSARGEGGLQLQKYFRNGSLAEKIRIPTENAIKISDITKAEAPKWCALGKLLVPYGGLKAINLQAGETIVISGSTGHFGGAAVAVALAMGAGCIIAPGRNERALNELTRRFGSRVRTVKLTGDVDQDRKNMMSASTGTIDCVLDILPPSAGIKPVKTAIMTVREYGRIALMGGVGMLGGDPLSIPYPWIMRNSITVKGQWMYKKEAPAHLIKLANSGLLSLDEYDITTFNLEEVNSAVQYAADQKNAFNLAVISL